MAVTGPFEIAMSSEDTVGRDKRTQGDEGLIRRARRRVWVGLLTALAAAVLFIALFVPTLDINKRQRANEASAVAGIREVNDLEKRYAASNPGRGFACRLSDLTPTGDTHDQNEFLVTGTHGGYRFAVVSCPMNPNGTTKGYEVSAVPIEPEKTGFRAFCADQAGIIWYDSSGSVEHCLASHHPLE